MISAVPLAHRLEVVEALVSVWGGDRVAVRIGPSGAWNGMSDGNPETLFDYAADQLNRFGLAYLNIIEPRVKGNVLVAEGQAPVASEQLRKIYISDLRLYFRILGSTGPRLNVAYWHRSTAFRVCVKLIVFAMTQISC